MKQNVLLQFFPSTFNSSPSTLTKYRSLLYYPGAVRNKLLPIMIPSTLNGSIV